MPIQLISYLQDTGFDLYNMREWLSGGAPPCQGGGRGFDSRLALFFIPRKARGFCFLCYISTERNDIRNVALFLYGVNGQTDVAGGTFA